MEKFVEFVYQSYKRSYRSKLLYFLAPDEQQLFFFNYPRAGNIFEHATVFVFFRRDVRPGAGDPVGRSHAEAPCAPLLAEKNDPSDEQTSDTADFLSLSLAVPPDGATHRPPALFPHRSLSLFIFMRRAKYITLGDTNTLYPRTQARSYLQQASVERSTALHTFYRFTL